jgi:membrane protein involved in colicin uptake
VKVAADKAAAEKAAAEKAAAERVNVAEAAKKVQELLLHMCSDTAKYLSAYYHICVRSKSS